MCVNPDEICNIMEKVEPSSIDKGGCMGYYIWQLARANQFFKRLGWFRLTDRGSIIMNTLKDAKIGHTVRVKKLHGEGPVKRRIMDMGITKGVEIYIRKVAPLGDPMELNVRGYALSLRKADAEMIEVE